jgi:hypothetical protein
MAPAQRGALPHWHLAGIARAVNSQIQDFFLS